MAQIARDQVPRNAAILRWVGIADQEHLAELKGLHNRVVHLNHAAKPNTGQSPGGGGETYRRAKPREDGRLEIVVGDPL